MGGQRSGWVLENQPQTEDNLALGFWKKDLLTSQLFVCPCLGGLPEGMPSPLRLI